MKEKDGLIIKMDDELKSIKKSKKLDLQMYQRMLRSKTVKVPN